MKSSFIILFMTSIAVRAQTTKDAVKILMESGGPTVGASTVHLEGTEQATGIFDGRTQESTFTFEYSSGGKTRRETKRESNGIPGISLHVFDGKTEWDYNSVSNTYTEFPGTIKVQAGDIGRWEFGRNPDNFSAATLKGEDTLEVNGQQLHCDVVQARYRKTYPGPASGNVIRTVSVCGPDHLIAQDVWEFDSFRGHQRTATRFTQIEWNIPIDEKRFVFDLPPGSKPQIIGGIIGAVPSTAPRPAPLGAERPVLTKRAAPEYTESAKQAGLQGLVIVYAEITPEGMPQNVRVLEGLGLGLDEQAVAAVQQWRFRPSSTRTANLALALPVRFSIPNADRWSVEHQHFRPVTIDPKRPAKTIMRPILSGYQQPDASQCPAEPAGGGRVDIEMMVSSRGMAMDVSARDATNAELRGAAVRAVEGWRFRPGRINGEPGNFHFTVTINCRAAGTPPDRSGPPDAPVIQPSIEYKVEPEYSEEARVAKVSGQVTIHLVVDATGRPANFVINDLQGWGLDFQAMQALLQWRFRPGLRGGKPVSTTARVEINFRLLQ